MKELLDRILHKSSPTAFAHVPIAGLQYYRAAELAELMSQGDELTLEHEQENPHDPNAVMVLWHQNKIGYIPSENAGLIIKEIEKHVQLCAKIVEIGSELGESRWVKLSIYCKKQ